MRCGKYNFIQIQTQIRRCCEVGWDLRFPPFRKVRERMGHPFSCSYRSSHPSPSAQDGAPFFVRILRKLNPLSPFSMLFIKVE
jgi:hypothetical protein